MFAAEVAAAAINGRLSPEVKTLLAKHNGRHVALALPHCRLVFVIGEHGELSAASSLVKADAEITPFANDGGNDNNNGNEDANIRIAGDAKLLSALSKAWDECADIEGTLATITGKPLAADITAAAKTIKAECKTALTSHLITEEELSTFKSKVRTFTTRKGK